MRIVLLLILVLTVVATWLYFDQATRQRWLADTPLAPDASVTTVYKWRDEQGNWQITDTPPSSGIDYERLQYQSDTNVMPLVPEDKLESNQD